MLRVRIILGVFRWIVAFGCIISNKAIQGAMLNHISCVQMDNYLLSPLPYSDLEAATPAPRRCPLPSSARPNSQLPRGNPVGARACAEVRWVGDRGRPRAPHATKRRADGLIRRFGRASLGRSALVRWVGGVLVLEASPNLAGAELGGGARSRRGREGIMSETGHTVQVTNLSSRVSESDLHEFFSFSGPIEHIELIRSEDYGATAYVTFKERFALETAVLLSGATIVDQPVCITYWGQPEETFNFWDRPTWETEEVIEYRNYQTCQYNTTPQEVFTVAQDIMKTMLAKGYVLSKDALAKARAFDESHGLTAAAAARAAELSKRIGLTDRVSAGVGAMRSVDETYRVTETTKTVATATGRTAAKVANGIVTSSYFSAGAMMLSDALTRAAKAAADLAAHGRQS